MNLNPPSEADFKQTFESANKKYGSRVVIHGLITFMSIFLNLFAFVLILDHYKLAIKENLGIDLSPEDCASGLKSYLIIPMFLLAGVLPLIYLIKQIKRARRKTGAHCSHCQTSLAKWEFQKQVCQTGICPACLEKLFEGNLASEQAAIEFHQKTMKDLNHIVRFSFGVSLAGLLIGLPILLWRRNSSILLGKNTLSLLETVTLVPVIFLMVPVSLWGLSKSSVSESQQHIKLFRDFASQSDTMSADHTHQEQEE